MENYKNVSQDIRDKLNAKAEAVQIILTGIDNDIYSTVDACPNTCEIWKAIERLKQVNEIRAERLARTANPLALVAQQQPVYHPQNHPPHNNQYSTSRSQQSTKNRGKAIVNSPAPIYDQEPATKIYKPTNNNLRTSSNTSRANQDNSLKINRGTGYDNQRVVNVVGARENVGTQVVQKFGIQCYNCKEYGHVSRECQKSRRVKDAAYSKEKMLLCKQEEAGIQLNAEQADWKEDTDDESDDQELEAHYMYMAQIQEFTPDPDDNSGPIFDAELLHKVQNNTDNYNVFAIENEHPEQPESVNDIYLEEQNDTNITIDSLDICYDRDQDDQDDTDELDQERDLLASLIEKLKCEIDDSKNHNKFLETSNKALVDILKDLKKFQAELDKYNDVNYGSKVEIDYEKSKGDLMSYKIEFEKSSNAYTQKINDLNQTILDMKKELCAHQETISVMSQAKEAQIKLYKTYEDKELDKVIALENKVKEMVADLRYFNSLEHEVDTLKSQPETQKTQFLNEIDRLSREYFYDGHMNAILGVYTDLDEVTNLQCDYLETVEKCEHLEKELSKSRTMSKSFEALQKHAINLELDLQQCKENIKNDKSFKENQSNVFSKEREQKIFQRQCKENIKYDKSFKENQSNVFSKEREQYFEIQDLKAQLQDKGLTISELKKLIEKMKGKSMETKFEKSSVIRQPNAFKSQRQSI
ncbi:gag-pol polyprotein [Tanacetum coccineum]